MVTTLLGIKGGAAGGGYSQVTMVTKLHWG